MRKRAADKTATRAGIRELSVNGRVRQIAKMRMPEGSLNA